MKPTIYPSIHSFTVTTTASRDLVLMVMAGWLAMAATRHSSICAATAFPNHWYPPEVLCTRGLTAFNLSLSRAICLALWMQFLWLSRQLVPLKKLKSRHLEVLQSSLRSQSIRHLNKAWEVTWHKRVRILQSAVAAIKCSHLSICV